jgi:hypothetical protein
MAALLHNEKKIGVTVDTVKLGDGQLAGHQLAHLTGTGGFTLDEAGRGEIAKYVAGGGTLVIDAAGGSSEFAAAAEKELGQIFPNDAAQLQAPLPMPSPLYPDLTGADVKYRSFARANRQGLKGCAISGIKVGGRMGVFFSREDLSGGLVGQAVDGVIGYTAESATKLMTAIVRDALNPPVLESQPLKRGRD